MAADRKRTPRAPAKRAGESAAGVLRNGWQVAGIDVPVLRSGSRHPANEFEPFAGFGTQRPNRVGDPTLPSSERSAARWFNTDAFQVAPQFTRGNGSRNPVRAPGYANVDLAFIKRTPIGRTALVMFPIVRCSEGTAKSSAADHSNSGRRRQSSGGPRCPAV